MKKTIITLIYCIVIKLSYTQCTDPSGLFTTNITHINAQANWTPLSFVDHYKINYRVLGATSWLTLGNIGASDSTRNIPLLQQSTSYEWRIKSYCDSTNLMGSNWSISDTFSTISFIPAQFDPIITNTLASLECNDKTDLFLRITQDENEPDIGSGTIVSNGGMFDIASLNFGDSVGYATLTLGSQTILTTLNVGLIIGQNYAVINSFDSTGSILGFFTVENENPGPGVNIQVLGSPNDGNNYTSGYVSELYFTDLFINPPIAGTLDFFADINSELNDQISITNTFQIICNQATFSNQFSTKKQIISVFDIFGRKSKIKTGAVQIYKFSDGTIEKKILTK